MRYSENRTKRKNRKPRFDRIAIIAAFIVAIILIIVAVRSCGADTETANTETSENGAYTETENTASSTEDEISASTETEAAESEPSESPDTETIAIEGSSTEEETLNHDIPDVSGLVYPFNTMSLDWGEDTLDGWYHYDIPTEYEQTGGYFPDAVQVYTYALCKQNNIDYPTVLAMIEVESGYKYNAVSKSGALGYMQVIPSLHSERLGGTTSEDVFLNPYQNIYAGIDYLCELSERFGSQEEVLTAYHYGVRGAYRDYWNKGEIGSPYSEKVLEIASRIRTELYGE